MSVGYGLGFSLVLEELGLNKENTAGAILIGSMTSYILYGISACQVITYYWKFPDDPFQLKLHVAMVWLVETTNAFLMVLAVWYYIIKRGADSSSFKDFLLCNDWMLQGSKEGNVFQDNIVNTLIFRNPANKAQSIPTEVCCFLVEIFFIMRIWRIADSKQIAIIIMVHSESDNPKGSPVSSRLGFFHWNRWLLASYFSRIIMDGLIAGTMCYVLWTRRPDSSWKSNTMRMINQLIMWTLTTGLLMWVSAVAFVVSSVLSPGSLIPTAVYFLRGRIHSNAMLAK
ncbi:hypothetical protein BDN70DRAFT_892117 [Pholiota conissans]|uniref:DUF6534 domain-containing protein n=1 Tax=Pholiota conissans TaxID=109636 RepID=A0A9P5ZBH0_9AGAR|nr:hypothetical protein BDN70DRAFT_892117 [Pholiota conissans]